MSHDLIWIIFALVFSITSMIVLNRYLNVHAFFSLLMASVLLGLLVGKPFQEIISLMQSGFGALLQQIGFIVALGSCLGMVLEKTGAMTVLSQKMVNIFGAKRSILAMSAIGMIVGIPVFCDSGFIILSRLIPSIATQASVNPAQLSLALSSGLYTTHTLVPPTPGPLAAAVNFGLSNNLGTMILIGIATSIPVTLVSYFFSMRLGRLIQLDSIAPSAEEKIHGKIISPLAAFLPLVLPIILIAAGMLPKAIGLTGGISDAISVIGQPVIALFIGLALSLTLIAKSQKKVWPSWIAEALKDAGIILLITGAGGAFGFVIKSIGVDELLKAYMAGSQAQGIIFMLIGFLLAAILKTAQGSTTSSMIITSSLLTPMAAAAGFVTPVDLSALILAIGGGAMTVSHANDSYFWVVSQFSGLSPKNAFSSFTLLTLIQGVTALLVSLFVFLI